MPSYTKQRMSMILKHGHKEDKTILSLTFGNGYITINLQRESFFFKFKRYFKVLKAHATPEEKKKLRACTLNETKNRANNKLYIQKTQISAFLCPRIYSSISLF